MDRDFDGRLSFGEFMGEETPLEKVFKSMDKDGSGTITKEVSEHISFLDLVNQQKNDIKGHKAKNKQKNVWTFYFIRHFIEYLGYCTKVTNLKNVTGITCFSKKWPSGYSTKIGYKFIQSQEILVTFGMEYTHD